MEIGCIFYIVPDPTENLRQKFNFFNSFGSESIHHIRADPILASQWVLACEWKGGEEGKMVCRGAPKHLILLVWMWAFLGMSTLSACTEERTILVNFGDSNSDTGGVLAGTGLPIGLPHGITFFHRGTGRLGDGRLIIDFFCKSGSPTTLAYT